MKHADLLMKEWGVAEDYFSHDPIIWLLKCELRRQVYNNNLRAAIATVGAFTTLLSQRLEDGERRICYLFAAMRTTEVSSAGHYKLDPGKCCELPQEVLMPLWKKIADIPEEEWLGYDGYGKRIGLDNVRSMIRSATK